MFIQSATIVRVFSLLLAALLWVGFATYSPAANAPIYVQPPIDPSAWPVVLSGESKPYSPGMYQSAGNGNDYDRFVWDNLTLPDSHTITEIQWRGGYDPYVEFGGYGRPVADFCITISTTAGPIGGPIAFYDFDTGIGNAGETFVGSYYAGMYGPTSVYDYDYVLPTPFTVTGGTEYWISIQAFQSGVPDWGPSVASGPDDQHVGSYINVAGGTNWHTFTGDTAFTLIGPVPEPGTAALLIAGGLAFMLHRRYKRRR